MTAEGRSSGIVALIESHLGGIFAAICAGFAAYLIGTTTTSHRLDELEADNAEMRADLKALAPRIDRLEVQLQFERENRIEGDKR